MGENTIYVCEFCDERLAYDEYLIGEAGQVLCAQCWTEQLFDIDQNGEEVD